MLTPITVMCLCAGILRLVAGIVAADRARSLKASLWLVASGAAAAAATAVSLF